MSGIVCSSVVLACAKQVGGGRTSRDGDLITWLLQIYSPTKAAGQACRHEPEPLPIEIGNECPAAEVKLETDDIPLVVALPPVWDGGVALLVCCVP